jgi:hypothetical protein
MAINVDEKCFWASIWATFYILGDFFRGKHFRSLWKRSSSLVSRPVCRQPAAAGASGGRAARAVQAGRLERVVDNSYTLTLAD